MQLIQLIARIMLLDTIFSRYVNFLIKQSKILRCHLYRTITKENMATSMEGIYDTFDCEVCYSKLHESFLINT